MLIDITISFIIRFLLIFIFARAVLHKLRNFNHFNTQLSTYRLVPNALIAAFSFFLILVEGFLAFSLLFKNWLYPSIYRCRGVGSVCRSHEHQPG